MTPEGVRETEALADALGFSSELRRRSSRVQISCLSQALQHFGPGHSFLDLACGLGFFPFGAAVLLPLTRGGQSARSGLLCIGHISAWVSLQPERFARRRLCTKAQREVRQQLCRQSKLETWMCPSN